MKILQQMGDPFRLKKKTIYEMEGHG